jgi:polysaccharide export outer membrane protein
MNYFSSTLLFFGLFSTALCCAQQNFLQQSVPKPVLTATPSPTPTQASGVATPAVLPDVSPSYVIGADDSLQVTVWKEPGLSGSLPVRPDGMISLSLLGDVPAAGKTPMQLGADLAVLLKKYVNDPSVSVTVLGVNSKRIFLLGEVLHIGAIPLSPGMTPLQAISAAGGLSPYANKKHIYILRGEQTKQQKIPFDYKKAIKDGNLQGVSLLAGDTIVVP